MTANPAADWLAAERRAARRDYRWLTAGAIVLALIFGLYVLVGDVGAAIFDGVVLIFTVFRVASLRKHGVVHRPVTAERYRRLTIVAALIALAFLVYAMLWAIVGRAAPALVFGLVGGGGGLLLAVTMYLNSRFLEDAAAAIDPEPVRVICARPRGPWLGERPPVALMLTAERVVGLRGSASGVSEEGSLAIGDITSVEADISRGNAVLHGAERKLAVHRALPAEVYALLEALRVAGVRTSTPDVPDARSKPTLDA
jgi:hypothetical protein